MANNTLASLEAALDRAVDAAVDAQAAVDTARSRAGLSNAPKAFYTTADMISEVCAAQMRFIREDFPTVLKAIRSHFDPTFKSEFAPSRPHTANEKYIDQLGARLAQADAIIAEAGDQARVKAAAPTTANVVQMASAREIIEAGRKRRGEAS
jgi:hypothetical protein